MKVAFLIHDLQLSGGVGVVVQHARHLVHEHGFDVRLVLVREQEEPSWGYESLKGLPAESMNTAREEHFDVAVCTWWETAFSLLDVPADRYAYFVQSLEDRFYLPFEADRHVARLTWNLPVSFITEARWIADTLRGLRPDAPCFYVRNGMDKAIYDPIERVEPHLDGPLRILIEGHPSVWFKGVHQAIDAAGRMSEPVHTTVVTGDRTGLGEVDVDRVVGPVGHREMAGLYGESHVVLKLSRVEGMFGPPLEGFHRGATCVTTEVTGADEYIRHGWNALLVDWDDPAGTARSLDLLARDRRLLHFLRTNALQTARAWPSWHQSSQFMALALQRIRRDPPPPAIPAARDMAVDIRAMLDAYRVHMHERRAFLREAQRIERVKRLPVVRQARRVRASPQARRMFGPFWPLLRSARRRLLG